MEKSTIHSSKKNKFIPLSASLIASVLFAVTPEYNVGAEGIEEDDNLLEIKSLHKEYHSLLNDVKNTEEIATDDVLEERSDEIAEEELMETETSETSGESTLVADFDEINEVKRLLLHAIEKAGSVNYANQLQTEDLTIDELDQIFEYLIVERIENDDIKNSTDEDVTEENDEQLSEGEKPAVDAEKEFMASKNKVHITESEEESELEGLEKEMDEEKVVPESQENIPEVGEEDEEYSQTLTSENDVPEEFLEERDQKNDEDEVEITETDSEEDLDEDEVFERNQEKLIDSEEKTSEEDQEPIQESRVEGTDKQEKEVQKDREDQEDQEDQKEQKETEENKHETEDFKSEKVKEIKQQTEKSEEEAAPEAQSQATNSESASKTVTYTVGSGDTLNKIANNHGVSVNHLESLNNIVNKNQIQVGQVLLISGIQEDLGDLTQSLPKSDFIDTMGSEAQKVAEEKNLYASVMIAQAALESGFGSSGLSSPPNHNLFGMKGSHNGESVIMPTKEYSSTSGWITINDYFKKYPSYLESLSDHAGYIRRGPSWDGDYYYGVWKENTNNYQDATSSLEGNYATDPTYASKLNEIISRYNLTRFDTPLSEGEIVEPPVKDDDVKPSTGQEPTPAPTPTPTGSTYKVKAGDTLSRISRIHSTSVSELKHLNNISSDTIYVGQTLKVNSESPTSAPKPTTPNKASGYTVKQGDTLFRIGRNCNTSVSELKRLNDLNSDIIYVGQTLKINGESSTSAPKQAAPNSGSAYTVKRGDTLFRIGRNYNTSVSELKHLNNLSSDTIYIGQTLKVNDESSTLTSKPTTSDSSSEYTVKRGDTLFHISRTHNTSVSELKRLNNLSSNAIYVGQTLKVNSQNAISTQKPTISSGSANYTVKVGDTLSHVSRVHNTSVSELKRLNNLSSDAIYAGQTLKVTGNTENVSSSNSQEIAKNNEDHSTTYIAQTGDTLYSIAKKYNTTVTNIVSWNNLESEDFIGEKQKLIVEKTNAQTKINSLESYQVVSSDTLSSIARKFNTTVQAVKTKNNLKADLILVGQTLKV